MSAKVGFERRRFEVELMCVRHVRVVVEDADCRGDAEVLAIECERRQGELVQVEGVREVRSGMADSGKRIADGQGERAAA